ncbi:hypothetical protein TNIN_8541 [Trichonephila inaurata madagascariensis]|uniref:Uncharacterized protein n=1 Tax=Trichonephila inaurata madagascariensis TaxID=2747483 RepID=A0A8X6XBK4_9ARAC|nr:hypothetical protein TNIN_8541 [Trichonephila inaurata madagascariensis]
MKTKRESLTCCNITSNNESPVLTYQQYASSLTSNANIPSISVFCVCGTAELVRIMECCQIAYRSYLKPGEPKILHQPLIDRKYIISPPLHVKLNFMEKFVKALSL